MSSSRTVIVSPIEFGPECRAPRRRPPGLAGRYDDSLRCFLPLLSLLPLLLTGCERDPFAANDGPVTGRASGAFECPLVITTPYDLGPAELAWDEVPSGVTAGLHTQGCLAQSMQSSRGALLVVRILQHTRFDRAQLLELAMPEALLEGDGPLFVDGSLAFSGEGGFGSVSLLSPGGEAELLSRVVGGSVQVLWDGERLLGSFEDLRLGAP